MARSATPGGAVVTVRLLGRALHAMKDGLVRLFENDIPASKLRARLTSPRTAARRALCGVHSAIVAGC